MSTRYIPQREVACLKKHARRLVEFCEAFGEKGQAPRSEIARLVEESKLALQHAESIARGLEGEEEESAESGAGEHTNGTHRQLQP